MASPMTTTRAHERAVVAQAPGREQPLRLTPKVIPLVIPRIQPGLFSIFSGFLCMLTSLNFLLVGGRSQFWRCFWCGLAHLVLLEKATLQPPPALFGQAQSKPPAFVKVMYWGGVHNVRDHGKILTASAAF